MTYTFGRLEKLLGSVERCCSAQACICCRKLLLLWNGAVFR